MTLKFVELYGIHDNVGHMLYVNTYFLSCVIILGIPCQLDSPKHMLADYIIIFIPSVVIAKS